MLRAVRAGSVSRRHIRSAFEWSGPIRVMLIAVRGTPKNARPCPVAGASKIIRSNGGPFGETRDSRWRNSILPMMVSSSSPGAAAVK